MRSGKRPDRRTDGKVGPQQNDRPDFLQAADIEEPLSRAISYGDALVLMGYGLRQIDADYGRAVVTIAEAITTDLAAVQNAWRQMMSANARRRKAPVRRRQA
jgi:hypothetical protein